MKTPYELKAGLAVVATTLTAGFLADRVVVTYNNVDNIRAKVPTTPVTHSSQRPQARPKEFPVSPLTAAEITGFMTLAASVAGAYVLAPERKPANPDQRLSEI